MKLKSECVIPEIIHIPPQRIVFLAPPTSANSIFYIQIYQNTIPPTPRKFQNPLWVGYG